MCWGKVGRELRGDADLTGAPSVACKRSGLTREARVEKGDAAEETWRVPPANRRLAGPLAWRAIVHLLHPSQPSRLTGHCAPSAPRPLCLWGKNKGDPSPTMRELEKIF